MRYNFWFADVALSVEGRKTAPPRGSMLEPIYVTDQRVHTSTAPGSPKFNVERHRADGSSDVKWCSFVSMRQGGRYDAPSGRSKQAEQDPTLN